MTKRAGKKKAEQRPDFVGPPKPPWLAKPGAAPALPATLQEDHLDPRQSLELEMRALNEGWLDARPAFAEVRRALINKVATVGIQAADPTISIKALRAIAQTEQRTAALKLQALALAMRPAGTQGELPSQVNVQINNHAPSEITETSPFEVIQELIARRDVRDALPGRLIDAPQPGSVLESGPVPAGSAP